MIRKSLVLWVILWVAGLLSGCAAQGASARQEQPSATMEFNLSTGMVDGRMVFIGVGGEIDGMVNPDLHVQPGDRVSLTLENGDGMPHDVALPDFGVQTPQVSGQGDTRAVTFEIDEGITGEFPYFCTVMGHRQAGMEGRLIVSAKPGSE